MTFPPSALTAPSALALVLALAACGPAAPPAADPPGRAEAAFPPLGRFLEVDGTRVHADIRGSGPDVILLHGAGGNTRDFTFDLAERLAERYRVIAFDRPGLGYTERLNNTGETPGQQAALLDRAAAKLGVEEAIVVGHSYGGAVAAAWAVERPARVAGLVSFAGAVEPWDGALALRYRFLASFIGGRIVAPAIAAVAPRRLIRSALTEVFAPQPVPEGYAAYIGAPLSLRPFSLRANAQQVQGLKPQLRALAPHYPDLDIPVEILHGDADEIVPLDVHSRALAAAVPGANLTVLPGVGHMPHHADPGAAVAAIDRAARRAGLR